MVYDISMNTNIKGKMYVSTDYYDRDNERDQNEYIVVVTLDNVVALMNPLHQTIDWVTYHTLKTKFKEKGEDDKNTK